MHEDNGVAGTRGQEAVELGGGAVVPPQRVDNLVMLLDAAQQFQTGSLVDVNAPAGKYTYQCFSTRGVPMISRGRKTLAVKKKKIRQKNKL